MKNFHYLISILILITSSLYAQYPKTDGIPIVIGDSIAQFQAAFETKLEPESYETPGNKGGYTLRLRTKGVWAFFDKEGKISTIRLDAPFKGNISGIKIGDTLLTLKNKLGDPVKKPFKFAMNESYLYYPDDTYSARFDVDSSGEIVTIFIIK